MSLEKICCTCLFWNCPVELKNSNIKSLKGICKNGKLIMHVDFVVDNTYIHSVVWTTCNFGCVFYENKYKDVYNV